jgi:hypothetical protein
MALQRNSTFLHQPCAAAKGQKNIEVSRYASSLARYACWNLFEIYPCKSYQRMIAGKKAFCTLFPRRGTNCKACDAHFLKSLETIAFEISPMIVRCEVHHGNADQDE